MCVAYIQKRGLVHSYVTNQYDTRRKVLFPQVKDKKFMGTYT